MRSDNCVRELRAAEPLEAQPEAWQARWQRIALGGGGASGGQLQQQWLPVACRREDARSGEGRGRESGTRHRVQVASSTCRPHAGAS